MEEIKDYGCLAGVYRDLAEELGVETAYKVYEVLNGLQVCFPKRFFTQEYTKKCIISGYMNGISVQNLSKQFGLTERRIRQLISAEKLTRTTNKIEESV